MNCSKLLRILMCVITTKGIKHFCLSFLLSYWANEMNYSSPCEEASLQLGRHATETNAVELLRSLEKNVFAVVDH